MRKIIVTDLTRFNNTDIVCTAGIDTLTGECIRPMPYLQQARCKELNLLPGAILEGDFSPTPISPPHVEDMSYKNLRFMGPCTSAEFRRVLLNDVSNSVSLGFNVTLDNGQKVIPLEFQPNLEVSIITILVQPHHIEVISDGFDKRKVKLHFTDRAGNEFSYIAISDLGFHGFAQANAGSMQGLNEINEFLNSQDEIFLRIGLSRPYKAPDGREGYWIQVNGIYTFPNFHTSIRCYQ